MEKKINTQVLTEVAIFAALAFVLDILQGGLWRGVWVSGGSIGLAMIPVIIISYRRGFVAGLLCGIAVSILQLLGGMSISPVAENWYQMLAQIAFDYLLTYPAVTCAGVFASLFQKANTKSKRAIWLSVGAFFGGMLKFLCHFLAGVIFWGNIGSNFFGIEDSNAYLYSFVYNISYMIPSIILTIVILIIIDLKQPKILTYNTMLQMEEKTNE